MGGSLVYPNSRYLRIKDDVLIGLLTGLIMGFIDTYGYCVTGYTTSEISLIIIPVIVYSFFRLLRLRPSTPDIFIASVIAFGTSLTSAITSGMYVTYTLLNNLPITKKLGIQLPTWLYFSEEGNYLPQSIINYSLMTLISASGIVLAYIFYRHFIDRERLLYPIGVSSAFMINTITLKTVKTLLIPFLIGFITELTALLWGPFTYDLTPSLQPIVPGMALSLGIDFFMLYLALIMPLNTSLGICLGNALMYLLIFPILAFQGLLLISADTSMTTLVVSSTPYLSSFIVGFILLSIMWYLLSNYRSYAKTLRILLSYRVNRLLMIASLALLTLQIIIAIVYDNKLLSLIFLPIFIATIVMQVVLTLVNMRVVGEVGLGSQAIFPIATSLIYVSGYKGAPLYVFADPFTGIPMPQYFAGSAMNVIKVGRVLELDIETVVLLLLLGILVGAPITLIYGHSLLAVYGLHSRHFSLVRWLPLTYWMAALYGRVVGEVFNVNVIAMGATVSIMLIALLRALRLIQISLFAILIGLTLTPDLLLTFFIASLIKYVAMRLGAEIQESLITSSALALAGAGTAVILHTLMLISMGG